MNYQDLDEYEDYRFILNKVYASKGDTVMVAFSTTFYR